FPVEVCAGIARVRSLRDRPHTRDRDVRRIRDRGGARGRGVRPADRTARRWRWSVMPAQESPTTIAFEFTAEETRVLRNVTDLCLNLGYLFEDREEASTLDFVHLKLATALDELERSGGDA